MKANRFQFFHLFLIQDRFIKKDLPGTKILAGPMSSDFSLYIAIFKKNNFMRAGYSILITAYYTQPFLP